MQTLLASLGVVSSTWSRTCLARLLHEGGLKTAQNHRFRGVLAIFDHLPENVILEHS